MPGKSMGTKKTQKRRKALRSLRAAAARRRSFLDYIKDGIAIARFDEDAIKRISQDRRAFWNGIGIIAIGGVAISFGLLQPWMIPMSVVLAVFGSFINTGIIHLISLFFGGKATFREFYRARAVSSVIVWPMAIPYVGIFLGVVVGIWDIIINIVTIRVVHRISTFCAVFVVLLPIIFVTIAVMLFAVFMLFMGGGAVMTFLRI